jgi:cyclopropane fatty-acyl-phospholipid synthase-like methyltransferase
MSKSTPWLARFGILVGVMLVAAAAIAQDPPPKEQDQEPPKTKEAAKPKPKGKGKAQKPAHKDSNKTYMGRPIADVMTYLGADWLVRPEREQEEQPEQMLDSVSIEPGMTVADVGAGVGYTSMRIARRVGPKGMVLATDLQPQMIQLLKTNMQDAGVKNVKPILCTATDPKLPEGKVDLAIMVDVYHECSHPEATLKGIRKALKPDGRLVLVEFRAEDPDVPIKPEHKMTLAQVRKEIEPQGYVFKGSQEFLPWQHVIIFGKGPDVVEKAKDAPKAAK